MHEALATIILGLQALSFNLSVYAQTLPQNPQSLIEEYFADIPVMVRIADCESGFEQFQANGELLRDREGDHTHVGLYQISEKKWKELASSTGNSIYTVDGNIALARKIYELQGTRPWKSSISCWSKT